MAKRSKETRELPPVADEVFDVASELSDAGFALRAIGAAKRPAHAAGYRELPKDEITAEALDLLRRRRVEGVAIELGDRGARSASDGSLLVPLALEHEGRATKASAFQSEWTDRAAAFGLTKVMAALHAGWREETPSGGIRWIFQLPFTSLAELETTMVHLPRASRQTLRTVSAGGAPEMFAELLTESCIIAPSGGASHDLKLPWVRLAGGPATIPTLSSDDLFALSDLLVALDERPATRGHAGGLTSLDDRTAEIRSRYNRECSSDSLTIELLAGHGWSITSGGGEAETVLHRQGRHSEVRVGGPARPAGSLWTWKPSASPLPTEQLVTGFDALLLLTKDPSIPTTTPADLAWWLTSPDIAHPDKPTIRIVPRVAHPRKRPDVYPDTTSTTTLVQNVLGAASEARHPTESRLPFLMRHARSLVTVDMSGAARVLAPSEHRQALLMTCQPKRKADGGMVFQHALPPAVVEAVIKTIETSPEFAAVDHVARTPILTSSGDVLVNPGYYPGHHALVAIPRSERHMWRTDYAIPPAISQASCQAAAEWLLTEVLGDFPFVTEADTARALAYFLTVIGRNLAPTVPLWLISAPDRGTGKTKLARLPRYVANGSGIAQSIGFSRNQDDEIRKAIVCAVLAGTPYLHVDELPRGSAVDSTVISEMVTSEDGTMSLRVLGGNSTVAATGAIVTVAGNNGVLGGDMNRRGIQIDLGVPTDSTVLASHRTGFRHTDLEGWVSQHRPQVLAACHTILAYGLRNRPAEGTLPAGLGSFEQWKRVILGSLSYVTINGRNAAHLVLEGRIDWETGQDEEAAEWLPLMQGWSNLGADWFKVGDLRDEILGMSPSVELPAELAQVHGQSSAGSLRGWARILKTRVNTSVRAMDGSIYRLSMHADVKRGNKFRVTVSQSAPSKESDSRAPETMRDGSACDAVATNPCTTSVAPGRPESSPTDSSVVEPLGVHRPGVDEIIDITAA